MSRCLVVLLVVLLVLSGLMASVGTASSAVAVPAAVRPLPVGTDVDYQLGGAATPATGVGIVVRDRTDAPVPGLYNVC